MRPIVAHATRRLIAGFARAVTGVSADWRGCLPEPRQRVYFANHASHGDFVLIWTVLPPELRRVTRPVAAAELWDRPGIGGFIGREVFRAVPIDRRGGAHRIAAAMAAMTAALDEGASLILFPEGTRNTGEEPLLPLRSGLFHLARAFPQIDFVPVWIDNISRVMPKGEFLPIPLLCSVTFGEPLAIDPAEERSAFLDRARGALLTLKPKELVT
jgi:1-acyl-sn-glycerol-3-phosphate acyltransferase